MFKNNRSFFIIAIIAIVNALGYGIIIPVLYSYSQKYGLSDFENGLLFALFSICQFISTPIIGRLSDRYGRKPLLLVSLAGTAVSFFATAFAPNALILFLARALDGLTAGNIPVASAVISDTTDEKDRARGFGIIGASFGFGFVFGPGISALTVGISAALPFIIAGVIATAAVILTAIFLPETNRHMREVEHKKLFDFKKLALAIFDKDLGLIFLITVLHATAFGMFIYVFQPFSLKIISLSANQISWVYTLFGGIGLASQLLLVQRINKKYGPKKAFSGALLILGLAFVWMSGVTSLLLFIAASTFLALANSTVMPLMQTILSEETDPASQGSVMGLQASYMSIGTIIGPILGGGLAEIFSIPTPFLAGGVLILVCFLISIRVLRHGLQKPQSLI